MSIRKCTVSWILSFFSLLIVCGTATAADASTPSSRIVPVPAPGQSSSWTMPLENTTAAEVAVWFGVTDEPSSLPLVLEVSDANGRTVFGPTLLADLSDAGIRLGELAAGMSTHYEGHITMPRDAGNDLQGLSQTTGFHFSLVDLGEKVIEPTFPDGLAQTGFMLSWLLPLALILILVGALVARRRKGTTKTQANGSQNHVDHQ